ncbi:SanA/YdcF family protein [Stackebrandtia albiflava]|uniref:SanA/YdcF family protein n=1 Tax=Stackebrandtia albiflava TaxID=406432 RepID=UPI001FCED103|nr:ElyC/SanA/YdcF family protein [Stackebrandtia albiflava]
MTRLVRWWTFRRLVILALAAAITGSLMAASAHVWVRANSADRQYTVDSVPAAPVALVLGARVDRTGAPSPVLAARLDLARELYESGKVKALLVSGDGGSPTYNEVDPMRRYLIDAGVPETAVIGDYAGFDTWDSCVRAARVFGVERMIVVTQTFHLDRAIALCRGAGIDTVGVGEETLRDDDLQWRRNVAREYLANVKAMWDALVDSDPTFLGPYETGVDEAVAAG